MRLEPLLVSLAAAPLPILLLLLLCQLIITTNQMIATDQGVVVHDDDGPPEEPFLHLGRKSPSLLLWDTSSVAATFNRTINAVENMVAHLGGVEGEENSVKHVSVHLCHQSILGSLEWREDFVVDNDCDDHQGGVGPGVGLLLLHLIL